LENRFIELSFAMTQGFTYIYFNSGLYKSREFVDSKLIFLNYIFFANKNQDRNVFA